MRRSETPLLSPVLIAGSAVLLIGFGIRASFGLFQIPIAADFGWPRAEFSLAMAVALTASAFAWFARRFSPETRGRLGRKSPDP